jgi:WD40 repeat protein
MKVLANGSRIAVRRKSSNLDSVEVYDIGAGDEATATQVGETVSCGANGDTVTLSADGTHLAVSCESFRDPELGANTGRVEIFEWNSTTWSSTGTIDGSAGGDFFGWSMAFSNDGNRIAISAPNHDSGGAVNRGQVRVFDFVGEEWSQVGADILGDNAADQQGFSMDLSGD